jgi:effector-binding domain-containing protein
MRNRGTAVVAAVLAAAVFATLALAETNPEPTVRVYIKKTEPHSVATILHKGPFTDMTAAINNLMSDIDKGGYLPAGPLMAMFMNSPETTAAKDLEWQVMIPVVTPGPIGQAQMDKLSFQYLDPMTVAYAYHVGPYDTVNEAYQTIFDWAKMNKFPIKGYPIEVYWSDPAKVPKDKLVTEVMVPIEERKGPAIKN